MHPPVSEMQELPMQDQQEQSKGSQYMSDLINQNKKASESVRQSSVEIKEFEVPTIDDFPQESIDKIEHMARVLELPATVSPKKLHAQAVKAVEVANQYRDQHRLWLKGLAHFEVQESAGVVKEDWHDRLATDVKLGRTIAVRGPAGNGKSTGVRNTLNQMGYNIYHLDCTDSTTAEQLVGGLYPEGDGKGGINMIFRDGIFTKAFKDPKAAIQLDEFDALDPRVVMTLQSALHRASGDHKRKVHSPDIDGGFVEAVGDCPIVVTMNTWGNGATREYVGRNAMDAASMDRFDSVLDTGYNKEVEKLVSSGFNENTAKWVVKKANEVRKKAEDKNLKIVFSTRRCIAIAEAVEKLALDKEEAFSRDFTERLEEMDRDALGLKVFVKK